MMVIMPPLASGKNCNHEVITTVVGRLVIAIPPKMGERIHGPRIVQHCDRTHNTAPYEQAHAELECFREASARSKRKTKATHIKQSPGSDCNKDPAVVLDQPGLEWITFEIPGVTIHQRVALQVIV